MIHAWCNVTYLITVSLSFSMNSRSNDDNAPDPEPWANDERLKDAMQVGTVNKAISLIKLLAEALEKAPIAPMPKTQSIPMLWESAKELKQKNFEDLQNACLEHETYVIGHPIDSGMGLSITIDKIRVFINKTLSTQSLINQLLIKRVVLSIVIDNGKIGQGMRSCKCTHHDLYEFRVLV